MLVNRRDVRRQLYRLAASQGGHFTAAQARSIGYTYQAQAHHVHAGNWDRVDRGLFRLTEWVAEADDALARWSLWAGGAAVVSHETALAVHDIGEFESAFVHLTVPSKFRKRDDAVRLHVQEVPAVDVEERAGFRLTTPLRTLIDVAAEAPDTEQLARALHDALDRGLVTRRSLRSQSEVVGDRAALHIERALAELGERR